MGSEWTESTLGELVDFTPKRTIKKGSIAPFVAMADLRENQREILGVNEKEYKGGGSRFTNGDTLFARITPCLENGKTALAKRLPDGAIAHGSTEFIIMAARLGEYDQEYIYYLARHPDFRKFAESRMEGTSGRQRVSWQSLSDYPISLPSPSERKRIAHILGSLDDKIELNRRMNATLEGIAQALFKSWFVDFDPVIDNALAAGNPIPDELADRAEVRRQALADGTANREAAKHFPDAFQETESMGWIPEGWGVKLFGQILRSVSDTYPLKTVAKVIFLNTGDILDGRFLHENLSGTAGLPGQAKKSIQKDDILYSEIRPKNRRFAYVHFEGSQHVVSTKLMVLRAISEISPMFAYLILKQDSTIDHLQMLAESRSGTFPQITFDILSKLEVTLPTDAKIVKVFTETILQPSFDKQLKNDEQTETLIKLRDTLLPKLISGEFRIPEAEQLAEEALI